MSLISGGDTSICLLLVEQSKLHNSMPTFMFIEKNNVRLNIFFIGMYIEIPSLGIHGSWFQDLCADTKIHRCLSPLYKMAYYLHITCAYPPITLLSLDYL